MAKKGMIGVQLSTIRSKIEALGVYKAMKHLHELGFRCIEISQVPMTTENLEEFKRAQTDFGIITAAINASTTAMFPGMESLETHYDKIVADCTSLNCKMLRIGMGPLNLLSTKEGVLKYCEDLNFYTEKLKADGIEYYYHNHCNEFAKFDGEYILDIMKDNSSIGFELDIHWIQAGGEKPAEVIKRYADRIRLLHLKDFRIVPITFDSLKEGKTLYSAIQFAEVGEGSLDIKECIEAGLSCGSEYFLIEQDSTYERDAFESLKISRDNLVQMGYEEWF